MIEILMPKLGLMQEYAFVIEWSKAEGDVIRRGDVLLVVETDKVEQEVESEVDGVLEQILVLPGTEVPVLTPIALVRPGPQRATGVTQ